MRQSGPRSHTVEQTAPAWPPAPSRPGWLPVRCPTFLGLSTCICEMGLKRVPASQHLRLSVHLGVALSEGLAPGKREQSSRAGFLLWLLPRAFGPWFPSRLWILIFPSEASCAFVFPPVASGRAGMLLLHSQ